MKTNPSREQLTKSLDRRIKHLMIQVLEKFEDTFPDLEHSRDGMIFKGDLKNAFNDVIRAQRDEVRDYEVDYRPLKLTDDNTLTMTQTFMQTVQKIELSKRKKPFIRFYGNLDSGRVLEALRDELNAGVIVVENDSLVLELVGIDTCVNSVFKVMDRYRLHTSVSPRYCDWRSEVVKLYRR